MTARSSNVLLYGSSEDALLIETVASECERAGIAPLVSFWLPEDHRTFDVACIFWCKHTAALNGLDDRIRRELKHAGRILVVQLDETPLHTLLKDATRARMQESGHYGTVRLDTQIAEWRRSVETLIPDIQSDSEELRRQLCAKLFHFKLWLARTADVPRDEPSWRTIGDAMTSILFWGLLVAGFTVCLNSFSGRKLAVVCIYLVFLPLWYFIATPYVWFLLDRIVRLPDDCDPEDHTIFHVFAGSAFIVTCLICAFVSGGYVLALGLIAVLTFSVVFILLALVGFFGYWLLMRVLYWLAKRFPAATYDLFIGYSSLEMPVGFSRFLEELEIALTRHQISYCDTWGLPRSPSKKYSKKVFKRNLRSTLQSSGFSLLFISDEYLNSRHGELEFTTVAKLSRSVLQIVMEDLSPINEEKLRPGAVRLLRYVRDVQALLSTTANSAVEDEVNRVLGTFLLELYGFVKSLCPSCHGHGTDFRYRVRFMPQRFWLRCLECKGTGLSRY